VRRRGLDRKFRVPRVWSNRELARIGDLFTGDVVNVSGWQDLDKEGRRYRDYFPNASSYRITNWKAEARGWQGTEGEIFLDLTEPLDEDLAGRFDVVFNHTTLEHIYDVRTAFANLCNLSRDLVILVVPLLQQVHGDYGDFWRFTPEALQRLLADNGFGVAYIATNDDRRSSVYVFAVGARDPEAWRGRLGSPHRQRAQWWDGFGVAPGHRAIVNPLWRRLSWEAARRRARRRSSSRVPQDPRVGSPPS
jgi:hypothetical protein